MCSWGRRRRTRSWASKPGRRPRASSSNLHRWARLAHGSRSDSDICGLLDRHMDRRGWHADASPQKPAAAGFAIFQTIAKMMAGGRLVLTVWGRAGWSFAKQDATFTAIRLRLRNVTCTGGPLDDDFRLFALGLPGYCPCDSKSWSYSASARRGHRRRLADDPDAAAAHVEAGIT